MAKGKQRPADFGVETTIAYSDPAIDFEVTNTMVVEGMDAYFYASQENYAASEIVRDIYLAMRAVAPNER